MTGVIIGVDPHKLSATIEVVDHHERLLGSGRFTTDQAGYTAMRRYVAVWPDRVWVIEGSNGAGRPLAQRLLEAGERVVDEGLLGLRSGIQSTVLDVRRIVEGLRPPALDELGLAEALVQLGDRLTASGKRTTVSVHGESVVLPAAVEVAAYRIVQEALTNAVRHSGAHIVTASVEALGDSLVLRVADDGTGAVTPRDGGVGLASMRERAEEIGGSFSLSLKPDVGTTVTARLPIVSGRSR